MYDAVLSYHLNPYTCGVAKFNHQLAQRLGVPCVTLPQSALMKPWPGHALVSVKTTEIPAHDFAWVCSTYDLLLHDRPDWVDEHPIGQNATRIIYADEIGIPSTLQGNPQRSLLNILLFGMAHKRAATLDHLRRLGDLLARQSLDYTISVSQAVHEGSPWDTIWTETETALRDIFGVRLRVLGYLADDALAKELRDASACALFFDPAARANNTTLWAALEAGCPLVTNLDEKSPAELRHGQTCYDVGQMTEWPSGFQRLGVALAGREAAKGRSWDKLIGVLCA